MTKKNDFFCFDKKIMIMFAFLSLKTKLKINLQMIMNLVIVIKNSYFFVNILHIS